MENHKFMKKFKNILWKPVETSTLFETRVCTICSKKSISPEGVTKTFTSLKAPNWVIIVPVLKAKNGEDNFIMVKQWRHGAEAAFNEFPGGVIDASEKPEDAAARELAEETGRTATTLKQLAELSPNPAIMENKCYIFYAEVSTTAVEQKLDEDEFVNAYTIPVKQVIRDMGLPEYGHAIMNAALFLYLREINFIAN